MKILTIFFLLLSIVSCGRDDSVTLSCNENFELNYLNDSSAIYLSDSSCSSFIETIYDNFQATIYLNNKSTNFIKIDDIDVYNIPFKSNESLTTSNLQLFYSYSKNTFFPIDLNSQSIPKISLNKRFDNEGWLDDLPVYITLKIQREEH